LCILPATHERSALENIDQSQRTVRRVSGSLSKLVSNFKEAIKKLIIEKGSEKLLKDLENHQRTYRKY
jgi:hypothetical protein